MRKPASMRGLEELGRVRLSKFVTMRDCLYSEIANLHGLANIPDHPDVAIEAGAGLARNLLDPLFETFGHVWIRSAYRSPLVNEFGNKNKLNCAVNEANYAGHIWDYRDSAGHLGATASVVIPWFAERYEAGRDWRDLAWWVHDHLPYASMYFFPKRAAFNLQWHEAPMRSISSYIAPKGALLKAGAEPAEALAERQARYADFPALKASSRGFA